MVPLAPCKDATVTPAVADAPSFKAGSPARTSLVEPGAPGTRLVLSGSVSGVTCGFIKGAKLDFWQADARGNYDQAGYRFRGHQVTDANGRYRLETIVPGPNGARTRLVNVRIDVAEKGSLTTQVFFPDEPTNARDHAFRAELVMKPALPAGSPPNPGGAPRSATFDFLLNM